MLTVFIFKRNNGCLGTFQLSSKTMFVTKSALATIINYDHSVIIYDIKVSYKLTCTLRS
jgi:hypothetical protein